MGPEEKARLVIDKKLLAGGYVLQDMNEFDPSASLGVVVREYPTESGEVDYLIFIEGKPVGVIEAKNLFQVLISQLLPSNRNAMRKVD